MDGRAIYFSHTEEQCGSSAGAGGGDYAEGATVNITANAALSGKIFDTWTSGDVTLADATSASTSFTMPANAVMVTATYKDESVVVPPGSTVDAEGNVTAPPTPPATDSVWV
jgi:hypothetical protein